MAELSVPFFTNEALARFVSAQGKVVAKVICHLWQNINNPTEPVEIIDNVELQFQDGQKLTISCNEAGDGLDAINFNYLEAKEELNAVFGGKIKLFAVDASQTKMWADVIGRQLIEVKLVKQDDYYKADALALNFGEEKREIAISPLDGLIIDFYEE